jgi:hypothetical protein
MPTDIFNFLYSRIRGDSHFILRFRGYSLMRFVVRSLANAVLPLYYQVTAKNAGHRLAVSGVGGRARSNVVVSLTTFPGRIDTVWLAIESILRQTIKPDAIILWLSNDQFSGLSSLPRSLVRLIDRGLRIEFRDGDLRSHKKYFFARNEFPEATLVLADDDIFYPTTMLEDLLALSDSHAGTVVCRFAKKIVWDSTGRLAPYIGWGKVNDSVLRSDIFFGSGGGVLIPPSAMHEDVLNENAFVECCPLADDIWLNAMCRLMSPVMISAKKEFSLLPVLSTDRSDLSSVNNGEQMNDRQLDQVRAYCLKAHGVDPFARPY